MTNSELAAALGCSESLIVRYRRRGMPADPAGARAWKQANVRPRVAMNQQAPPQTTLELDQERSSGTAAMTLAEVDRAYRIARLEREQADAASAQVKARLAAGELVVAADVKTALAEFILRARDHALSVPDRITDQVTAACGPEAHADRRAIWQLLNTEMRAFMTHLATCRLKHCTLEYWAEAGIEKPHDAHPSAR